MGFKKIILVLLFLLAIFTANALAQVCFDPQTEEMIELTHPTGSATYYVAINKDFSFKLTDHGKTTYDKGTTKLIFSPSSFVTKNTTNLTSFVNAALSEFNDATRYTKDTPLTETTVAGYKAYYIEYTEAGLSEKGRATVIIGDIFEDRTKTYTINMRSKTQRFEEEKTEYQKLLTTFSLDPFDECVDQTPAPPDEPSPPTDPSPPDSGNPPDNSGDPEPDLPNPETNTNPNAGSQSQPENSEFKILGFDGVLVIAGVVLLLLLLGIGFVILVVIGVIVYFFFIKKR